MILLLITLFFLVGSAWAIAPYVPWIQRVDMKPGKRMLRLCLLGQHEGKLFFRIDLWFYGIRITLG